MPTLSGLPPSILPQATGPSPATCKCALGTCQLALLGEKELIFVYFLVVRIEPGLLPTLGKPSTRKLQPQPWFFSPYRPGHAHNLSWGDNLHFLAALVSVSRCFSLTPWAALCSSSCKCFGWCLGYFLLELESLTYFFFSLPAARSVGGDRVLPAPGYSLHPCVETLLELKVNFFGHLCFGVVGRVLFNPRAMVVTFCKGFQNLFDFPVCSLIYP